MSIRKRVSSVLFWSIISAAFIGPGTVTAASKAGASFGTALLWALSFSIVATIVLQEAAARLTIGSGKNLGAFISSKLKNRSQTLLVLLFLSVAFGCAAYQAGNILGAVAGLELISSVSKGIWILIIGLVCGIILLIGNYKTIAKLLGVVVALMGAVFIYTAFQTDISASTMIKDALIPSFPNESSLLIIGLIGTTIVPYNLFLASGISKGQAISEMRWGLIVAVIIGGLISMAILMVGTKVTGVFSFEALANTLSQSAGPNAKIFFGIGLFCAGISSSITAPLAAAITAQSLFETGSGSWSPTSIKYRMVWIIILVIGLSFGISNVKPIPAIILAQAINGLLLPVVAIFLLYAINDKEELGAEYSNKDFQNILTLAIVFVAIFLGLNNIISAFSKATGLIEGDFILLKLILSFLICAFVASRIFVKK